jgi:DNA uptake protein ComE-like DNA-binding protein
MPWITIGKVEYSAEPIDKANATETSEISVKITTQSLVTAQQDSPSRGSDGEGGGRIANASKTKEASAIPTSESSGSGRPRSGGSGSRSGGICRGSAFSEKARAELEPPTLAVSSEASSADDVSDSEEQESSKGFHFVQDSEVRAAKHSDEDSVKLHEKKKSKEDLEPDAESDLKMEKKKKKKNINDATYDDFMAIPTIGKVTTEKLLKLREVTPLNESILANTQNVGQFKLSALKMWFHVPAGK